MQSKKKGREKADLTSDDNAAPPIAEEMKSFIVPDASDNNEEGECDNDDVSYHEEDDDEDDEEEEGRGGKERGGVRGSSSGHVARERAGVKRPAPQAAAKRGAKRPTNTGERKPSRTPRVIQS